MWVDVQGRVLGSVTIGGCVDARVIAESLVVLETGVPALLVLQLGDEDAAELGMTCAGSIEVLVEPVTGTARDPLLGALAIAEEEVARGRPVVLVRPLERGSWMVVRQDGSHAGSPGAGFEVETLVRRALEVLAGGESRLIELVSDGAPCRVYFEVQAPPLTLLVIGASQLAMDLVRLAHQLGWRTVVVDGRESFANRERFPDADEILVGMPSEIAEQMHPGPATAVVLLAHDYKYDLPVLRVVLGGDAGYVGVLGSRRRGRALKEFLAAEGLAPQQLERVRVPIGLDIGARTTIEIALSILAEALAVLRGRAGGPLAGGASCGGAT
jgi:xanthine dehydrogenase accessory factor